MYTLINEIDKLRYGSYIRWIYKGDTHLQKGMIVCDILIGDEGINIKGKTFGNRFLTICMDKCHIYQKMTNQERIIQKIKNVII